MMIKKICLSLAAVLLISLNSFAQHGTHLLIKANKASLEKRYDEAIGYYSQYIKLNPKDFRGYFNRGTTEYNAGKHSDGIADFSTCLMLNPIYKEAYYYRGKCKEAIRAYDKAVQDFTHVLSYDSLNVGFLKARANSYFKMEENELALKDLNTAISVNKLDGHIYNQRAKVKVAMGRLYDAIVDYDMVEMMLPKYHMVHFLKGNLYKELGMMDEACEEWHIALDHGVVVADRDHEKFCHE
ncbi:MAG: tetratricopeptide repeat protein [Bacteroidia bacterium]